MINVLHLINYPGKGGSERYILSLAEKLHNSGCVFYLGYSVDGPMIESARALGIKTFNIPMNSPFDLRAAKMVKDLCGEYKVDIAHTHFLRENYVGIFSRMLGNKVSLINTSHLIYKKNPVLKLTNMVMSLFLGGMIAVSHAVKDQMAREGIDPRLIQVIYSGVDAGCWKGKRSGKARKEFGLDRDHFVITSVARFSEEKGHLFLLETVSQLKKAAVYRNVEELKKVKFLLVGDGELLEECKNFASMLGVADDIVFTGFRSDIKSILHASDLYVSHSKSEAFGISILEALASGLPVIATKAGGSAEIMDESHHCGLLVEYGDMDGFAEAIRKFATDKKFYNACRQNTVSLVEEKFSLDKMAEETYNLYKMCADKRRDISR